MRVEAIYRCRACRGTVAVEYDRHSAESLVHELQKDVETHECGERVRGAAVFVAAREVPDA